MTAKDPRDGSLRLGAWIAGAALCLVAGVTLAQTPPQVPQFTDDERAQLVTFWADPQRYAVAPPPDFHEKGLWQVRLTTDGSTWLWNYNKVRNVSAPPTFNAQPANDQQRGWETWVLSKLAHDRWQALQTARQANKQSIGVDVPAADKATPEAEPPEPGPIPPDLLALAGDPPPFANAVVPMQHTIAFDDVTIQYLDNTKLGNPRYAYYRFSEGVDSLGQAVKDLPPERFGHLCRLGACNESEARVMRSVSPLEGGFDAINTYDTGYVSVGFIQFASLREGRGSLGAMLLKYKQDDPADFARDFHKYGVDVAPDGLLDVVDPQTGAEVTGPDANKRIIVDKRLIAVFQRAGQRSDAFCAAQIKSAKEQFYPANDPITVTLGSGTVLTGKVCDFIKSEAGMATLFDRKVNTGKIAALASVAAQVADAHQVTALQDLSAYEREIIAALKYRANFLNDQTLSQPGSASGSGGGHKRTRARRK